MHIFMVLLYLILNWINCEGNTECCKGTNVIRNRTCLDGGPLKKLACDQKYVLEKNENISYVEDDYLWVESSKVPPDRFCASTINDSEIYLVCFETNEFEESYVLKASMGFISVFFMLLTIFIYTQVPDLLDTQGICILHTISGMAAVFLILGIIQTTTLDWGYSCLVAAYIMYFTSLYAFFWLNVLSFHIWRTVTKPKIRLSNAFWLKIYHIYGIGTPIIFFIFLLTVSHSGLVPKNIHPGLAEDRCWFKSHKIEFIYFYGPISILLCLNLIYYLWTIGVLCKQIQKSDEKKAKVLKYKLMLCVKLSVIMGIPWIFEIISAATEGTQSLLGLIWIITDTLNALQGVFIFLVLVVFRKKVIRGLSNRTICCLRFPSRWKNMADNECEEIEEEYALSETQIDKTITR